MKGYRHIVNEPLREMIKSHVKLYQIKFYPFFLFINKIKLYTFIMNTHT